MVYIRIGIKTPISDIKLPKKYYTDAGVKLPKGYIEIGYKIPK